MSDKTQKWIVMLVIFVFAIIFGSYTLVNIFGNNNLQGQEFDFSVLREGDENLMQGLVFISEQIGLNQAGNECLIALQNCVIVSDTNQSRVLACEKLKQN